VFMEEVIMAKKYDKLMEQIADYVCNYKVKSEPAIKRAYLTLFDALGCAMQGLSFPECRRLVCPQWPSTIAVNGARVPGTTYQFDPAQAAFAIGTALRWTDYTDLIAGATPLHPSENAIGIIPVVDYLNRFRNANLRVKDVLALFIKSAEITGKLAELNDITVHGYDNIFLIGVGMTPVIAQILGGNKDVVLRALSQSIVDAGCTAIFRRPGGNVGWRKSWAPGDIGRRSVILASIAMHDATGYKNALTFKQYGYYDVCFGGKQFKLDGKFTTSVIKRNQLKIPYPAEGLLQTLIEAAIKLHGSVKDRLDDIKKIAVTTLEPAYRYTYSSPEAGDPTKLTCAAARDHSLVYVTTLGLVFGKVLYKYYENDTANSPQVRKLFDKFEVKIDDEYTKSWFDMKRCGVPNALQVFFKDGSKTKRIFIEYPVGHPKREKEGEKFFLQKLKSNLETIFTPEKTDLILNTYKNYNKTLELPFDEFIDRWIP